MNLLNNLNNGKKENARDRFGLTDIVGILDLISKGHTKKEISQMTGRSENSLQYKFFENPITQQKTNKDGTVETVKVTRSVKKYATMEDLYAAHNTAYSVEDQQNRIAEFQKTLRPVVAAV